MSELADLGSHPIVGIAAHGGQPFAVPLFSQIADNLWMGGCPVGDCPQFDHIINLYPWGQYRVHPGQTQLSVRMLDSNDVPDAGLLEFIVAHVRDAVSRGPTLVHCQAGLNRSGLITALVLIDSGATPDDAIAQLRARRSPVVLCNQAFEAYVRSRCVPADDK